MIDLFNSPEKIGDEKNEKSLVQRKTNHEEEETDKVRANKT